jgi:hypothetical protein
MKNVIAIVAVAGAAAAASALPANIDRSGYTIYTPASAQAIDTIAPVENTGIVYSNMTADTEGFFSVTSTGTVDGALDVVNFDDYQSTAPGGGFLDEFRFVGGVGNSNDPFDTGGVVFFDFFDAGGAPVDGFGVVLNAGNFIYTINITNNDVAVAGSGFVQMSFDDEDLFGFGAASQASFFLTADDATVGNNLLGAFPGGSPLGADLNHTFELNIIPTPGAAAVLGFAGLAATRRRR